MRGRGSLFVYRRSWLFDREAHTKPAAVARSSLQAPETMRARLP